MAIIWSFVDGPDRLVASLESLRDRRAMPPASLSAIIVMMPAPMPLEGGFFDAPVLGGLLQCLEIFEDNLQSADNVP
jgi:hypothetical protein